MTPTYVFDANAILDFAEGGKGEYRVREILQEALHERCSVLMSVLNWGEVFYQLWSKLGEKKGRQTLGSLSSLPLQLVPIDLPQALKAAEIKVLHHIPYVDCIAAALAQLNQGSLVTSDRDFEKLGRQAKVLWLPRK